ncbi:hypothetical protein N9E48_10920 [Paracoccaceae bacterium]|nr:hypothetical protein [Paracoccaceae bacterium]
MEPMGHIAGFKASVSGGVATVLAAALAIGVNVLFNAPPPALNGLFLTMAVIGLGIMVLLIQSQ